MWAQEAKEPWSRGTEQGKVAAAIFHVSTLLLRDLPAWNIPMLTLIFHFYFSGLIFFKALLLLEYYKAYLFIYLPHYRAGEGNGTPVQYSCLENPMEGGAWWAPVHGVAKSQTWLSDFPFTFHFHALKEEMATHSSVLAWRIPGTGEPGGLPSMGVCRVRHDWSDIAAAAAVHYKIPAL